MRETISIRRALFALPVPFARGQIVDGRIATTGAVNAAGGSPAQITSQPTCLYADLCVDARRNRLIAIKEERPNGDVINAINALVAVDIQTGSETVLDAGSDFYASPALSAAKSRLAWLSWRHPNMPWTANQLSAAEFDSDGALTNKSLVAGSDPESIFQPQWLPDGRLYFISDRTDFWNLYRWNGSAVESILVRNAEFGVPQWLFGLSTYAFTSADALIYSFTKNGMWYLGRLDTRTLSAFDYALEAKNVHRPSAAVPRRARPTKIKNRESKKSKIAKTQECKNRNRTNRDRTIQKFPKCNGLSPTQKIEPQERFG